MATWTISECNANIAILKQAYTEALGSADRERFEEGATKYEYENRIKSISNQLTFFERELARLEAISEGKPNPNCYIPRREFGV